MVTLFNEGDGIKGDRVIVQCRAYNFEKHPIKGTSRHKLQRGKLEGSVYCVIAKTMKRKK
jgi:hypothetical protein